MGRRRDFYFDVIKNTFAFGIYLFSFHIIMMPYLAKNLETNINAKLLLFVMINNILTITFGNELGVFYQILQGRKPRDNNISDLFRLLIITNILLPIILWIILVFLRFDLIEIIFLGLTSIFGNTRFFLQGYLRQRKKFTIIGIGNAAYLLGISLAIFIFWKIDIIYWLPIFLAELFSVIILIYKTKEVFNYISKPSMEYKSKSREYVELSGATLLTNIPTYSDKLLILPLLGDFTMAVYYAGTVLSKMLFLIVNPINAVLLSWLSSDQKSDEDIVIKNQIRSNYIILLLVFIISIPFTYILTRLFYSQFLEQIVSILVPLSLISAFTIAASFLKVVFLRYFSLNVLKYINILHLLIFLILAPLGAKFYGLNGFIYGAIISKVVLWISFLLMLTKGSKWKTQTNQV